MKEYFFYLMVYSFIGWCCESTFVSIGQKKWVNSGFLNGPFVPIYGFGAVLGLFFLTPLIQYPLLVFILGILITSTLEYFTSWLMEVTLHVRWWDYSHYKYHINGRVCLLNSFLFGIMSLVLLYGVHPYVVQLVVRLKDSLIYIDLVLLVYFIIDFGISLSQFISFKQELHKFELALQEVNTHIKESMGIDFNERFNDFIENSQLKEVQDTLNKYYAQFRENNRYAVKRLRKTFPNMRISPKHEFKTLITTLHDKYDNRQ